MKARRPDARLRILMAAYACEPDRGSECEVGWRALMAARELGEVWLVTHPRHRRGLDEAQRENRLPGVHLIYVAQPPWVDVLEKCLWRLGYNVSYYLWQLVAFGRIRRLAKEVRFDLSHHVTWVRYWQPSFLALIDVPFVWGPVGGAEGTPRAFRRELPLSGRLEELARDLFRHSGEYDPLVRLTARKARVAVGATEETSRRVRNLGARVVCTAPAISIGPEEFRTLSKQRASDRAGSRRPIVLSVGRLLYWKGFHLGLRAFAKAGVDADYVIVGEGPARKQLKELAATLGLVDRVSLLGRVPRAEVFELLSRSSVLLHPSLHDSGGAVCLEAMAAGAPVVCLDVGGPGEVVRSDCGVAVAALSPSQVVDDLAEALQRLLGDPQMRAAMGSRARARVGAIFREDRRVERQLATYASVLSKQPFGSGGGEAESVPVMRPILRPGEGRSGQ